MTKMPIRCNAIKLNYYLIFLLMALHAPMANSVPVYFNDFQGPVGSEWSSNSTSTAPNPNWPDRRFLGEFSNDIISLSLSNLPTHEFVSLSFDLFLIRSWDGSSGSAAQHAYGDDLFTVKSGNTVLLHETFSNGNPAGQTFGPNAIDPYMTGASEKYSLGYIFHDVINNTIENMDSVYRLTLNFADAADNLLFSFIASNLQTIDDESWGLDNVNVEVFSRVAQVGAPTPLPLLFMGLVLMWIARWRCKS